MKTKKMDHIGVAVKNIAQALPFYQKGLQLELKDTEEVSGMKVKVAKLSVGETTIELIEPLAGNENVAKFLSKRGEGIHHICFEVEDIDQATEELKSKGYQPIYEESQTGAGGKKVNFLKPKDTAGVLIELIM